MKKMSFRELMGLQEIQLRIESSSLVQFTHLFIH